MPEIERRMPAGTVSSQDGESAAGGTPRDPVAFLREAEAATNAYDADRAAAVYAPDAVLESIVDGAQEVHRGRAAVRGAWQVYLGAFQARRFRLEKRLVARTSETIVSEWASVPTGRQAARGMEVWCFAEDGAVIEHRLFTFLDPRCSDGVLARLRLLLAAPGVALAMLREQRRAARDG